MSELTIIMKLPFFFGNIVPVNNYHEIDLLFTEDTVSNLWQYDLLLTGVNVRVDNYHETDLLSTGGSVLGSGGISQPSNKHFSTLRSTALSVVPMGETSSAFFPVTGKNKIKILVHIYSSKE